MLKQFSLNPIAAALIGISLSLIIAPTTLYAANVTDNFELDGNAIDFPVGPQMIGQPSQPVTVVLFYN